MEKGPFFGNSLLENTIFLSRATRPITHSVSRSVHRYYFAFCVQMGISVPAQPPATQVAVYTALFFERRNSNTNRHHSMTSGYLNCHIMSKYGYLTFIFPFYLNRNSFITFSRMFFLFQLCFDVGLSLLILFPILILALVFPNLLKSFVFPVITVWIWFFDPFLPMAFEIC